jgi:hypothetical protein
VDFLALGSFLDFDLLGECHHAHEANEHDQREYGERNQEQEHLVLPASGRLAGCRFFVPVDVPVEIPRGGFMHRGSHG